MIFVPFKPVFLEEPVTWKTGVAAKRGSLVRMASSGSVWLTETRAALISRDMLTSLEDWGARFPEAGAHWVVMSMCTLMTKNLI